MSLLPHQQHPSSRPLPPGSSSTRGGTEAAQGEDAGVHAGVDNQAAPAPTPTPPLSKAGPTSTSPSQSLVSRAKTYANRSFIQTLLAFGQRVNQDRVTKLAAMLAYYLVLSVIPILVMLLSFFGLLLGILAPQSRKDIIYAVAERVPGATQFLPLALAQLTKHSGPLAVLSVLTAAYFGSRLFKTISYCFGIIFRVPPRSLMPEQFMAVKMLLLFIVLVPVLVFISAIPGFVSKREVVQALLANSAILAFGVTILSILTGWLIAFVLFLTMYVVIPNRHVPLWLVWRGALIAGALLEVYGILFPFYAAHYLDGQDATSSSGFALVVVIFFYYFGLVLLLGAEINAFLFDRDRQRQSADHLHQ
ncbi:MAG: YihY/virulence factor BrkB family protein [Ktedonobacterales bacterium]